MNFYKRKKKELGMVWNFHGELWSSFSSLCVHFTCSSEASPVPATTLATRPPTLNSVQFSSVAQSCLTLCHPMDFPAHQASLSITNSRSLLKLMSIKSLMPSSHLILCHPLLLLPSIFPSIRGFFQGISSSHEVAKVLEFQLQHQSFQ